MMMMLMGVVMEEASPTEAVNLISEDFNCVFYEAMQSMFLSFFTISHHIL